jgi:MarR-like DNA-binding transcriptional regulator SgrR of sgrS sRNA
MSFPQGCEECLLQRCISSSRRATLSPTAGRAFVNQSKSDRMSIVERLISCIVKHAMVTALLHVRFRRLGR